MSQWSVVAPVAPKPWPVSIKVSNKTKPKTTPAIQGGQKGRTGRGAGAGEDKVFMALIYYMGYIGVKHRDSPDAAAGFKPHHPSKAEWPHGKENG